MSGPAVGLPGPAEGLRAVVVVPARDEARRIGACLAALTNQADMPAGSYEVIVVLDGCRDQTASLVAGIAEGEARVPIHVLELPSPRGVGYSRRMGMDLACLRLLELGRPDGLIASTDADSRVAENWLSAQLALAAGGAQAIGGLIELEDDERALLDPGALADRDRAALDRLRRAEDANAGAVPVEHHHFSGASLALTAGVYRRCGGLPARAALEDEALAAALVARRIDIHRSRQVRVRTSARTDGRAPRGLAHDLARGDWRARRSLRAGEFTLERLLAAKQQTISLILPSREVAATIGVVAETAAGLKRAGLLDEVLVVDADSRDGTASIASRAGLEVVREDELLAEEGTTLGKGDAMRRGLAATTGEIVAFADTDTDGFHEGFLLGLIGPLVCDPTVEFVKGTFRRPFRSGGAVLADGGGRVTELMARPLLNLHAPALAVFDQPLAGETSGRRELLESIPFAAGYGVEIAMLIDCWRAKGLDAMAQVDLGERQNRHQPLRDLSAMAYAVLIAAQTRFLGAEFADRNAGGSIVLPPAAGQGAMESRAVAIDERPPLAERLEDALGPAAGVRLGRVAAAHTG